MIDPLGERCCFSKGMTGTEAGMGTGWGLWDRGGARAVDSVGPNEPTGKGREKGGMEERG